MDDSGDCVDRAGGAGDPAGHLLTAWGSGLWHVNTGHSVYLVDFEAVTVERFPVGPEAAKLRHDTERIPFAAVPGEPVVGESWLILVRIRPDCDTLRGTTAVVSYQPVTVADTLATS